MNVSSATAATPATASGLRAVKYFLTILTPLLVLLALILWHFQSMEREKTFIEIKTLDSQRLAAEQKLINQEFQTIISDLLAMAGQNEIIEFVDNNDRTLLDKAVQEYLLISKHKGIYDQIRFIDTFGQEQIRVNFNNGTPLKVPEDKLQNKSDRYYFKETLNLPRNGIYTSAMDLNIEQGEIEYPLKPMIRFGTPIFNSDGQKKGILVLNYLADHFLSRISAEPQETSGEIMLINAEGFWLYSPKENEAWGFMFAAGKNRVFANSFPAAWENMADKESGSFFSSGGFFTFQRIYPLQGLQTGLLDESSPGKQYPWTLICRVPPEHFRTLNEQTNKHFLKLFAILTLGAILTALILSWALLKRKKAEHTAGLALAELSQVFDTVEDGILIMDADLNIVKVNDRFTDLWQIDTDAAVRRKGTELLPLPEHMEPETFRVQLLNNAKTIRFEVEKQREDGSIIHCQFSAAPLQHGTSRPFGAVGCLHDITAYKQAALALRESNDRFALVVAGTNDGIWDWNIATGEVYFSPRWLSQCGYREGELEGRFEEWQQRLHPEDKFSVGKTLEKYLQNDEYATYEVEYRFRHKDGFYRWFQCRGAAIRDHDGKPYRMAGSQTDITARKKNEQHTFWRATQDSALAELSSSLLSEHSIAQITESVIDKSKMLTGSLFAFAGYIDNDTGNLVCPAMINDIMDECKMENQDVIFNKCAGLWGWVIENGQPILANDAVNDPRSTGVPPGHIPVERFVSVPAMINDELVGIVAVANSDQDYTEQDIQTIKKIATLFALAIQRKRTDESIHRLLLGTAAVTGEQFFATMVEQLAKCLGTKYVLVGEILPESPNDVTGLAFWNGDALGEPFHYRLADTPCEKVHQSGFCLYDKNVASLFPNDKELAEMNIQFYAGIPLRDTTGTPIGILCALHDAPLTKITHINEIFQIFSNRTSGEIERQRAEKALALAKDAAESANNA
ncbi:MAG: PAS domain S-box protein, partial [Desulfobulbaceae bacterium]|nr:PAS domain S-box protein [Desulfobulbaceae bacterium]